MILNTTFLYLCTVPVHCTFKPLYISYFQFPFLRSNGPAVGDAADLGTFMLSLQSSENTNEYSYSALPIWAGPAQWKNRAQFDALKGSLPKHFASSYFKPSPLYPYHEESCLFSLGLNKGNTKRKPTARKKVFRINFDEAHDFDKLFSKGKVNQIQIWF